MNHPLRAAVAIFAAALLIVAAFPPDTSNSWQFIGSRHFYDPDWPLIVLECIGAVAIGLLVWVFAGKGEK